MTKETQKLNNDLFYRDSRITKTDDPLQDYYSTLETGSLKLNTESNIDTVKINGQKIPDPKKHQIISFIKSVIRIGGYAAIPFLSLEIAALILIFSEMVGIIEELV